APGAHLTGQPRPLRHLGPACRPHRRREELHLQLSRAGAFLRRGGEEARLARQRRSLPWRYRCRAEGRERVIRDNQPPPFSYFFSRCIALMSLVPSTISSPTNLANSAGELATATRPSSASRLTASGSFKTLATA